jgi:hypothetical protein
MDLPLSSGKKGETPILLQLVDQAIPDLSTDDGLKSKTTKVQTSYLFQRLSPTVVEVTKTSFHLKKSLLPLSLCLSMN